MDTRTRRIIPEERDWARFQTYIARSYSEKHAYRRSNLNWFEALYARYRGGEDLTVRFVTAVDPTRRWRVPAVLLNEQMIFSGHPGVMSIPQPRNSSDLSDLRPRDQMVAVWMDSPTYHEAFNRACRELAKPWAGTKDQKARKEELDRHPVAHRNFKRLQSKTSLHGAEDIPAFAEMRFSSGVDGNTTHGAHYDNEPIEGDPTSYQRVFIDQKVGNTTIYYLHPSTPPKDFTRPTIQVPVLTGAISVHLAFNVNRKQTPGGMLWGPLHSGELDQQGRVVHYMQSEKIPLRQDSDRAPLWTFEPLGAR